MRLVKVPVAPELHGQMRLAKANSANLASVNGKGYIRFTPAVMLNTP